uniref:Mus musculus n=1 Tax=Meloidogyne hapla TaxID=6305 RepID=A0A1I8BFB5_MELHA
MLFVIVTCKDDLNNLTKSEKRHKFISKLEPIPEDDELTKEEINRLKKEKEEKNKREMAIFYNQLVDEDEENVNEDEGLSQKSKSKNDFVLKSLNRTVSLDVKKGKLEKSTGHRFDNKTPYHSEGIKKQLKQNVHLRDLPLKTHAEFQYKPKVQTLGDVLKKPEEQPVTLGDLFKLKL